MSITTCIGKCGAVLSDELEQTAPRPHRPRLLRLWEKAPRFVHAHEHNGHSAPELEAKVPRDETEAPTATAPTPAKRPCKTAPKKSPRKRSG